MYKLLRVEVTFLFHNLAQTVHEVAYFLEMKPLQNMNVMVINFGKAMKA